MTRNANRSADAQLLGALDHVHFGFYLDLAGVGDDGFASAFQRLGWRAVHIAPSVFFDGDPSFAAPVGLPDTAANALGGSHQSEGDQLQLDLPVARFSLSKLFELHGNREIHWMRVRASDEQALSSWSDSPSRPWVIIAVGADAVSDPPWHEELAQRGYSHLFLSEAGRVYVSNAHPEIEQSLRADAGPEVEGGRHVGRAGFQEADQQSPFRVAHSGHMPQSSAIGRVANYVPQGYSAPAIDPSTAELEECRRRLAEERRLVAKLEARQLALSQELNGSVYDRDLQIQLLQQQLATSNTEVANLRIAIDAIYRSTSWSITAPMRWAVTRPPTALKAMKSTGYRLSSRILRRPINALLAKITKYPELTRAGRSMVRKFPAIEAKLIALAMRDKSIGSNLSMLDAEPESIKAWQSLLRG